MVENWVGSRQSVLRLAERRVIFVDASAIIAILAREPEAPSFSSVLHAADDRITSPIAVYEAVAGLGRLYAGDLGHAEQVVQEFLQTAAIDIVPVARREGAAALAAFKRFGKGRGHPAQLNMGDCFAYASAREANCSLLYKGDDFSRTDIASALAP